MAWPSQFTHRSRLRCANSEFGASSGSWILTVGHGSAREPGSGVRWMAFLLEVGDRRRVPIRVPLVLAIHAGGRRCLLGNWRRHNGCLSWLWACKRSEPSRAIFCWSARPVGVRGDIATLVVLVAGGLDGAWTGRRGCEPDGAGAAKLLVHVPWRTVKLLLLRLGSAVVGGMVVDANPG